MELKYIRQNVFLHLIQSNSSIRIDDCIAFIIAEILGHINAKNASSYMPWAEICLGVKRFKTFNKEALLEKIRTEILQNLSLEDKCELLGETKIYSFDGDNIIFTDVLVNIAQKQPSKLRNDYGEKDYVAPNNEKPPKKGTKTRIPLNPLNSNINSSIISREETNLNTFWRQLETSGRKGLLPFWKWKVTTDEFLTLEEKLITLLNSERQRNVIENHAFKIALYYSEWYKREYEGHDSSIDDAFGSITAKSIWENLSEIVQNKYLIIINDGASVRWDDSLRLLGGLPLSYLTRGGNNPSRAFARLFKDFRNGKESDLNELSINNQALQQSTKNGGSIYEYIHDLINENYPFADDDKEQSPFKEFIAFVETGLKEYKKNILKKFSLIWQVKQHPDFVYLYPTICVKLKPEEGGSGNQFISYKRLNDWGITAPISSFEIAIRLHYSDREEPLEKGGYYFNKCGKDKFLSRSAIKWDICREPKNLKSIEFVLKSGELERKIQTENIPNYIQLWNTSYGEWSNRQRNGAKSSVLFLNNKAYSKDSSQQITVNSKKQDYYWANINRELIILNGNKEKKLFQKKGAIEVLPQESNLFSNSILYPEDGKLSYIQNEKSRSVYLLRGAAKFDVCFIDCSGSNREQVDGDNYTVKYKTIEDNVFKEYTSEIELEQGFVTFQIIYKDIYKDTVDCYALSSSAGIQRVLGAENVKFNDLKYLTLNNNTLHDDESSLESDIVDIKIGTENSYLTLPIIRPLNRPNDLFYKGKYVDNNNTIPLRFVDDFEVREINDDGVTRKVLAHEIDKFQKLRVIYNKNKGKDDKTGIIGRPNWIKLTTYTKEITRKDIQGEGVFYSLAEGQDLCLDNYRQYKFCFLSLEDSQVEDLDLQCLQVGNNKCIGSIASKKVDGVAFQSFKDGEDIFQETYRPFFVAADRAKRNLAIRNENRETRIERYKENFDFKLAIKHFELAIEHKLYFGMFDILLAMEDKPELLARFYLEYHHYCSDQKSDVNYTALHRLADELLFDWILIPRRIWTQVIKNDKNKEAWVLDLFSNKKTSSGVEEYALRECCRLYWDSALKVPNPNNIIYKNIKRKTKLDDFFKEKYKEKFTELINIDKSNSSYTNLLKTLQK
jgi:hypothetical protein